MRRDESNMVDFRVLYATLFGRVDEAVTVLERMSEEQACDWFHVIQVTEMLKSALLEAEERYIEEAEDEPHLTVLTFGDDR